MGLCKEVFVAELNFAKYCQNFSLFHSENDQIIFSSSIVIMVHVLCISLVLSPSLIEYFCLSKVSVKETPQKVVQLIIANSSA